jgi:uncharacterized membrane protein YhhN
MNKKVWVGLFGLALIGDLVCIQWQLQSFRFVTKPLIVLFLISYFISSVQLVPNFLKWWVVGGLALSWLGDVLLLFEERNALFFILGLSAFLLAHICYIVFFNKIRRIERMRGHFLLFLFVLIYYAALMQLLGPELGDMKVPVWIYGAVISTMLWVALHLNKVYHSNSGLFIMMGAILFVLSDTALAINKFYQPFTGAGIVIMLTYGLAQWFIAEGSIRWLHNQLRE